MRFTNGSLFIFFALSVGMAGLAEQAKAQCVQSDVSLQAAITGSRSAAQQSSAVQMSAEGPCTGTHTRTESRQVVQGGTPSQVIQRTSVSQEITPGEDNGTGVRSTVIQVQSNPTIDVYNPADGYPH